MKRNVIPIITTAAVGLIMTGCVERLIRITTEPPGGLIWLNDEEVGAAPVTVPFTWYGRYELVIRKDGFQTIRTSRETPVPFYQWPGLDFCAEALLPCKLVDHHEWHYNLTSQDTTDPNDLIQRARKLRTEALSQP